MNINEELKDLDESIHLYDDIVSSLSISMASARASRMALVARQRELKGFVVEAVDMLRAVRGMQGVSPFGDHDYDDHDPGPFDEAVSYRFDDYDYDRSDDDIDTHHLDQYGSDVLS